MGELRLAFYDGVFDGDLDALVHLCDVEGSVVPDDRPSFALLEEARRVLEMCREKYSAPRASGQHFTVLLGRKLGAQLEPLARFDVVANQGLARASVMYADDTWTDINGAAFEGDDDAVTTLLNILEAQTDGMR
ncbi:hypothetical protein J2801_002847 [Paraburkholderia phenoliruptrix]|uniref:hypothetical protein n=1 Tax=Paraburkholderia phenoliruptrix TaxID=252970 RepID=UPI002867876F|nr:hypothetical protein [Paraburkholderia phenoliruptrix]MDR6420566.1 hypothetical protein [Paraburkholderia phenoliruptrix]